MGKSIFPEIPEGEVLPFVDGWDFVSVLGEGGFGEVRLVYNSQHRLKAAVKVRNKLKKYLNNLKIFQTDHWSRQYDPRNKTNDRAGGNSSQISKT